MVQKHTKLRWLELLARIAVEPTETGLVDAEEYVILVDAQDRQTGVRPKLDAHRSGERHRAVSVFITDGADRVLLQRRSMGKYHSPGLWANACCGHPRPGEATRDAAERRLREELGLAASLSPAGLIAYQAQLPMALIENEVVHLFVGRSTATPVPDPSEVDEWKWMDAEQLARALHEAPESFAAWFRIYADRVPELAIGSRQ